MSGKAYSLNPLKDRFLEAAGNFSGLAIFGVAAVSLFSPAVLGVALLYGAAAGGLVPVLSARKFLKSGGIGFEALSDDAPASRYAKEISDALGRAAPPKIYLIPYEMAKEGREDYFGALPGTNVLVTTREALAKSASEEKLRFILAHEISHLQVDRISTSVFKNVLASASTLLAVGGFAMIGLSGVGVGVSHSEGVAAAQALLSFIPFYFAREVVCAFSERIAEKRADRNALYVTRDLKGARAAFNNLYAPEEKISRPALTEVFSSHPSYTKRISALTKSFNEVSKYPAPKPPVNDNVPVSASSSFPKGQGAAAL